MAVDFFRLVNSKGPACCQYLMKSGAGLGPHKGTKARHGFIQTVLSSTKNIELVTVYMWTSSQGILILALQSDQGMTWIHSKWTVLSSTRAPAKNSEEVNVTEGIEKDF